MDFAHMQTLNLFYVQRVKIAFEHVVVRCRNFTEVRNKFHISEMYHGVTERF